LSWFLLLCTWKVFCLTLPFDAEEGLCNLECIETTWTAGSSGSSGFISAVLLQAGTGNWPQ